MLAIQKGRQNSDGMCEDDGNRHGWSQHVPLTCTDYEQGPQGTWATSGMRAQKGLELSLKAIHQKLLHP